MELRSSTGYAINKSRSFIRSAICKFPMSPSISIPLLFLDRPEDRGFVMLAIERHSSMTHDFARLCLFRIWRDFAMQGSRIRTVPMDTAERSTHVTVRVLEEVCDWQQNGGKKGSLVELAIESGFLKLVPCGDGVGNLVPLDFAAMQGGVVAVNQQPAYLKGGSATARAAAGKFADRSTEEALDLFRANKNPILSNLSEDRVRVATRLIFQVSRIMGWQQPKSEHWTEELIGKADQLISNTPDSSIQETLAWLSSARHSDEIPGRIDILLDGWKKLPINQVNG